jgi:hypothetical protein
MFGLFGFDPRPRGPGKLDAGTAKAVAEPWDEGRTKFARTTVLRAETWTPPLVFPDDPIRGMPTQLMRSRKWRVSPDGRMAYANTVLPAGEWLRNAQGARRGWVCFTADVTVPVLYKLDASGGFDCVWMSYTPLEVLTARRGVSLAKGTVVVGGYGLGWFLRKVHDKPSVKRVIVVEQSASLLDWYAREACRSLPKVSDVICGDVRAEYGRHGKEARYLVDIWETYGAAPGRAELDARKAGCRVWCWGEYEG